jgi:serine protease
MPLVQIRDARGKHLITPPIALKNTRDIFHGTAIISQIVGQGGGGVAGAAPKANMIPIRVVGDSLHASDVINAFLFAGNLHPTIENNKPAQVISVSINTDITGVPCSELMQSAIDQLVAQNVVIAGATGNNSTIYLPEPINCKGVIPVAAVAPNKTITSFSNINSDVFIAAPGGGTDLPLEGIYMASYASAPYGSCTKGDACFTYKFQVGTSFAAPLVAAAAADILSIKPTLTLSQIKEILTKSSKPFVGGGTKDNCNTVACLPATVGMLDAKAAIDLATQY